MPIEIVGLDKAFGEKKVFQGFSAALPDRGVVAVMGPSGSGKTTLINILMGLEAPDAGRVTGLEGKRFTAVFQEDRLLEGWSALRNIRLALPGRPRDGDIVRHLEKVGLGAEAATPVRSLSGGMKRRVALVRAVMAPGEILVLDEPFKGLDDAARAAAIAYVRENAADRLILLVTHDRRDAEDLDPACVTLSLEGAVRDWDRRRPARL